MTFSNPPAKSPENIRHETYFSPLVQQAVGYNIYLPPDYAQSGRRYPVAYHLHGYQENESSNLWAMEKPCRQRDALTVFVNGTATDNGYGDAELPIESMIITELIPHIDASYRTKAERAGRAVSGFSMGGAAAFRYALEHADLFSAVTAYAGTYHHWFGKGYQSVGEPREKAAALYEAMMPDPQYTGEGTLLHLIRQNAQAIRANLAITMITGSNDPLICDNEILHMYLTDLDIPHIYQVIEGPGHELDEIT